MATAKFTAERHREVGAQLYRVRNRLLRISVEVANSYGKTKRNAVVAERAFAAVDELRCRLDSQFARDYPEEFDVHAYYPGEFDD